MRNIKLKITAIMNKENKTHRAAVLRGMQALLVSAAVLCTCGCKDWEGLVNNEKPFTIHSIVPSQLMANDTVTIKGIGFDDAVKVLFNQTEGTIVSKSADAIKVVLPEMTNGSDALTEKIAVREHAAPAIQSATHAGGLPHPPHVRRTTRSPHRVITLPAPTPRYRRRHQVHMHRRFPTVTS